MKKTISIAIAVMCVIFISSLIITQVNAQGKKKGEVSGQIPADVMKIIDKSCAPCHSEPSSNFMAISHVNFSSWDKYAPAKQAAKAKDMCTMVTKDKMPPKMFTTKRPDLAVTTNELNTLCNWAQSLQGGKKK
jgi:uncharacterized membrane protein